jgi:pSer/pThr/pTyr-binding forkhead associated (FHA) protein/anti-anti-sigma regulatory factor
LTSRLVSGDDGEKRSAPLPVEILATLKGRVGPHPPDPAASAPPRARLIVEAGRATGRAVAIRGPRFVIGRHPSCQLRPKSPTISRYHTAIELRDGRVLVRDLGGANGTVVDGRALRREAAEARDGTRLRVGPLQFLLRVDAEAEAGSGAGAVATEDLVARWLLEGEGEGDGSDPCAATLLEFATRGRTSPSPTTASPDTSDLPESDVGTGASDIKCKVVEGILVLYVMLPALDGEEAVGQLRETLARLHEQTTIRHVVVSHCNVAFLSRSAMGVLVARMLRLEWEGGGLRLCYILTPVMAALKKIHLPMLVETYPTLEDAVLTAWGESPR